MWIIQKYIYVTLLHIWRKRSFQYCEDAYLYNISASLIEMLNGAAEIQHSLRPSHWVLLLCSFPSAFRINAPLVSDVRPCLGALLEHGGQRCHTLLQNKAPNMNFLYPSTSLPPLSLLPSLRALGITAVEIDPAP